MVLLPQSTSDEALPPLDSMNWPTKGSKSHCGRMAAATPRVVKITNAIQRMRFLLSMAEL